MIVTCLGCGFCETCAIRIYGVLISHVAGWGMSNLLWYTKGCTSSSSSSSKPMLPNPTHLDPLTLSPHQIYPPHLYFPLLLCPLPIWDLPNLAFVSIHHLYPSSRWVLLHLLSSQNQHPHHHPYLNPTILGLGPLLDLLSGPSSPSPYLSPVGFLISLCHHHHHQPLLVVVSSLLALSIMEKEG